jgi:hemerythrin-like metal-binding protein
LLEQAQKLYPHLKVLLASGFQGNQVDNKIKFDEDVITKPYGNNFLLSRVRNCLDKQDANMVQNSSQSDQKTGESSQVKKIIWSKEMTIDDGGILDADHKSMFKMLARCQDLLEEQDFQQPVQEMITELVQETQEHFSREELAMKEVNYPYTKNHCNVHQMLVKQLTQKIAICSEKEILLWLSTEMSEWLVDHLLVMDKPLHKYFMKGKELVGNGLKGNTEGDINDQ